MRNLFHLPLKLCRALSQVQCILQVLSGLLVPSHIEVSLCPFLENLVHLGGSVMDVDLDALRGEVHQAVWEPNPQGRVANAQVRLNREPHHVRVLVHVHIGYRRDLAQTDLVELHGLLVLMESVVFISSLLYILYRLFHEVGDVVNKHPASLQILIFLRLVISDFP